MDTAVFTPELDAWESVAWASVPRVRPQSGPQREEWSLVTPLHTPANTQETNTVDPCDDIADCGLFDDIFNPSAPTDGDFEWTASGYLDIVDEVYENAVEQHPALTEDVSKPLFGYYCNQIFWHRAQRLDVLLGRDEIEPVLPPDFEDPLPAPTLVHTYLASLGMTRYQNGCAATPAPIFEPEDDGSFGALSAKNSDAYASFPAPSIAVDQIKASLSGVISDSWRPPSVKGLGTSLPTGNLLGWCRPAPLTPRQHSVLVDLGWTSSSTPAENRYLFNPKALVYVSQKLSQTMGKLAPPTQWLTAKGSRAQLPVLQAPALPTGSPDLRPRVTSNKITITHAPKYATDGQKGLAVLLCLRLDQGRTKPNDPRSPAVPQGWPETPRSTLCLPIPTTKTGPLDEPYFSESVDRIFQIRRVLRRFQTG